MGDDGLAQRRQVRLGARSAGEIEGAKRLFVVSYRAKNPLYFYEPATGTMEVPEFSDETVAVWAASAPWAYLRKKGSKIDVGNLIVDERDPDNRVILNPITDENWKLVGLAGLIVDQDYFEDQVLPQSIKRSLPRFEKGSDKLTVVVRDARKRQVLPRGSSAGPSSRKTPAELTFWAWQRQNP